MADNGQNGIEVQPIGSGAVTAVFNRVEVNGNTGAAIVVNGYYCQGAIKADVSDSVVARNGSVGFYAISRTGFAPTSLSVFHSVATNNQTGLSAGGPGNSTVLIAQSMITDNTGHGWFIDTTGLIETFGDNYFAGNGPNQGSLTAVSRQ